MARCRTFNGSSYINCGNITAFNGASTLSMLTWWYMPNGATELMTLCKGTSASTPFRTILERWTDGVMYMGANKNSSSAPFTANKLRGWHHIAYLFNAGDQILYIDGHDGTGLGGTGSCSFTDKAGTTLANVSDAFMIGVDSMNLASLRNTSGTAVSHTHVFTQVLTQHQVKSLMRDPYCYPYAPVAHWPMIDDAAGSNEPDVSGNGWNGTWVGTKTFSDMSPFPAPQFYSY